MKPLACINSLCSRSGVKIFTVVKRPECRECGHDLYPYDDYEWTEEAQGEDTQMTLLSGDFPDDYNGTGIGFQNHMAGLANMTAPMKHSMREAFVVHQARRPAPPNDTFSCPPDLTGCPIASRLTVEIPYSMYQQWVDLAKAFSTEWIAYLKGKQDGSRVIIESMYFPDQIGTPAHVDAVEGQIQEGTIAAVHSHVGMQAFFSPEDVLHMNHLVELVVNRAGDLVANGRTTLACGRFHRGEAEYKFTGNNEVQGLYSQLKQRLANGAKTLARKMGIGEGGPAKAEEQSRSRGQGSLISQLNGPDWQGPIGS